MNDNEKQIETKKKLTLSVRSLTELESRATPGYCAGDGGDVAMASKRLTAVAFF